MTTTARSLPLVLLLGLPPRLPTAGTEAVLLKHVPGMSYLPKEATNSPTFDGDEKIKVPANSYGFMAPGINDTKHAPERPRTRISHAQDRETITQAAERNIA